MIEIDSFNWTCPYCKAKTTIVKDTNDSKNIHYENTPSKYGKVGLLTEIISCPNTECKEITVTAALYEAKGEKYGDGLYIEGNNRPILNWNLKPESSAITLPEYIPEAIKNDYYEACKILLLSPKASATLSRRCLQGIIRDFWKINKSKLVDEINELHGKIDSSTWDSIEAIRKIGNIGAHMEKDVNLIIDIDKNEAGVLINLLEELFFDWYVQKHEREERHKNIINISSSKIAAKTMTS